MSVLVLPNGIECSVLSGIQTPGFDDNVQQWKLRVSVCGSRFDYFVYEFIQAWSLDCLNNTDQSKRNIIIRHSDDIAVLLENSTVSSVRMRPFITYVNGVTNSGTEIELTITANLVDYV